MVKDICESACIEGEHVQKLRNQLIEKNLADVAGIFKALGDPTRLKIAYVLMQEELCVCDISSVVGVSLATASHHLRLLRDLGYATYRKEGKLAYYSIINPTIKQLLIGTLSESKVMKNG